MSLIITELRIMKIYLRNTNKKIIFVTNISLVIKIIILFAKFYNLQLQYRSKNTVR